MVLETERLVLRHLTLDDRGPLYALLSPPAVSRFIGGPLDEEEQRRRIAGHVAAYAERGYGAWAVERKEDGALLGRCGLHRWTIDGVDEVEVGYAFGEAFRGRGYATEAARATRDWGFRNLDVPHLVSIIDPLNAPSLRVAERNGMTPW